MKRSFLLMAAALFVFLSGVIGTWRFRYCLNRLHAAAVSDTLGLLLAILSLAVAEGFSLLSLKLILVAVLLWIASPVSSHLIARMEIRSSPDWKDHVSEKNLCEDKGKEDRSS